MVELNWIGWNAQKSYAILGFFYACHMFSETTYEFYNCRYGLTKVLWTWTWSEMIACKFSIHGKTDRKC